MHKPMSKRYITATSWLTCELDVIIGIS